MDPIRYLLNEHGVIMRLAVKLSKIPLSKKDEVISFFRIYADELHHGKEEKIFFTKLKEKNLPKEDLLEIDLLIKEHVKGRALVTELEKKFSEENKESLLSLYRSHIAMENSLFPVWMGLFSEKEQCEIELAFLKADQAIFQKNFSSQVDAL